MTPCHDIHAISLLTKTQLNLLKEISRNLEIDVSLFFLVLRKPVSAWLCLRFPVIELLKQSLSIDTDFTVRYEPSHSLIVLYKQWQQRFPLL
jgi:hypothetical protein